jgi:hypothetical protein
MFDEIKLPSGESATMRAVLKPHRPILLITGYGMNFDNLPLLHNPNGVWIASVITAAL